MKAIFNLIIASLLVVGIAGCATTTSRETSMGKDTNKAVCMASSYKHTPSAFCP